MRLHKIIAQLNEKDFHLLSEQLKENNADKFHYLLHAYRKKKLTDPQLLDILSIQQSALYTLKSRLYAKVQELLYKNNNDTRIELLQNVANIEHLIYKAPKETAVSILKRLEEQLIKNDMPNELIDVYKALKTLHINSKKFYDYSQLYNKHVAFYLAQDKALETLSLFCKTQSEYFVTRNIALLDYLVLYKKEMNNICRLYKSHHLQLFKNVLSIHFALFTPSENETKDDPSVEDMLNESLTIIEDHLEDRIYKQLSDVLDFLYFEYYHQIKVDKNAIKYFEKISPKTDPLLLFSHFSFVYHFLYSKVDFLLMEGKQSQLIKEEEITDHEPDIENVPCFIMFHCYKATAEFYASEYELSLLTLKNLLKNISFKNMLFPELEIKSFLALLCVLTGKKEDSEILIRSISRKMTEEDDDARYLNATNFLKILKTAASIKQNKKHKKLIELNKQYIISNNGNYSFMPYLKLDYNCLLRLSK